MAKNYSGRDYTLWLATDGGGGEFESDYSQVGKITSLAINESRNAIETSNKDDGDSSSFIAGRRSITIDVTAIYDHTSDTGQAMFTTAMEAANGTLNFLITTSTASDKEWYGAGVITALNFDFPDEDTSTVSATIQVTGALYEVVDTGT